MNVETTAVGSESWSIGTTIAEIAVPGILRRRAEVSVEMIGRRTR
jgi:hypothetical protein